MLQLLISAFFDLFIDTLILIFITIELFLSLMFSLFLIELFFLLIFYVKEIHALELNLSLIFYVDAEILDYDEKVYHQERQKHHYLRLKKDPSD